MPTGTAVLEASHGGETLRRRGGFIKAGLLAAIALILLSLGLRGRQEARWHARIADIVAVRKQLEQSLNAHLLTGERLFASLQRAASSNSFQPVRQPPPEASQLKRQLEQLELDFASRKSSREDDLEVRMSKATLANAQQRYAESLTILTVEDERNTAVAGSTLGQHKMDVLVIRGMALHGAQRWNDALDLHQRVLGLKTNHLATLARVVECLGALNRREEAAASIEKLARSCRWRADNRLVLGKASAAISDYETAIAVQSQLVAQEGRGHAELGVSYHHHANALLFQGKAAAAQAEYEKAIALLSRSPNNETMEAAKAHQNLSNALFSQGKRDAALASYDKTLALLAGLDRQGLAGAREELARTCNNRGVVQRASGKAQAALADFERAVESVTPGIKPRPQGSPHSVAGRLDVTLSYSDRGVDALVMTRIADTESGHQASIIHAISLRNRGHAQLVDGRAGKAAQDFQASADIYVQLVEREGRRDLWLELGRSLTALAWNYATSPNSSLRNGSRAEEYALKACEAYEWRGFAALDALAAACAEAGQFARAIQWQQKAIEVSPVKFKPELESRLGLYRANTPYRAPAAHEK